MISAMKSLRPAGVRGRLRGLFVTLALLGALPAIVPAQASANDFFGVVPQRELTETDFNRLGGAKVETLRLGVNWPNLQPRENSSDEIGNNLDDEMGGAAAEGIRLLPFVNNSPKWVVGNDEDVPPLGSSRERDAFKNFMRLLVERYGPGGEYWNGKFLTDFPGADPKPVNTWQIWNEPSSPASWEPRPSARDYGELVKLAENAIHDVDPGANVMLAGIFYSPSNNGPEAPKFMKAVLDVNGVKKAVDSAAVHAYGGNVGDVEFQIKAVRKAMDSRGAQKVELFVTETGWSTGGDNHPVVTSESGQAKKLKQLFSSLQQQKRKWNLGGVYWYSLVDGEPSNDPTRCDFCRQTGLFKANRAPKPAWDAFKRFTE